MTALERLRSMTPTKGISIQTQKVKSTYQNSDAPVGSALERLRSMTPTKEINIPKPGTQNASPAAGNGIRVSDQWVSVNGGARKSTVGGYDSRMSGLQEQRRQAQVDLNTDEVSRLDREMKDLRTQFGRQTVGDRVSDTLSGMVSGYAADLVGAAGTVSNAYHDPDHNRRQIRMLTEYLKTGRTSDGRPVTPGMEQNIRDSIHRMQQEIAAWEAEDSLTNRLHQTADRLDLDSGAHVESAKRGLGTVGQAAVDLGIAGGQLLGDVAASAIVPGAGTAAMAARVFGGSAREARQAGASIDQQVGAGALSALTSVLTERIGNVAGPFRKAFGKGLLDNVLGKASVNAAGKLVLSALSEGGEEILESAMQPIIQRLTYDPSAQYDQEWMEETLYSGLIGAALGGIGGSVDVVGSRIAGQIAPTPQNGTQGVYGANAERAPMTDAEFARAQRIGGNFGAEVTRGTPGNGAVGKYQDSRITLAENADTSTLVHELTHHMETAQLYDRFSQRVMNFIESEAGVEGVEGGVEKARRIVKERYAAQGITLDDAAVDREVVANFAEEKLFRDEKSIERLYREDPTLFQRIYDWIRDQITKVRGTAEERFLTDAQRLYEKALRNNARTDRSGAAAQYTYGGQNARTANIENLNRAEQLRSAGADNETIRRETGWLVGDDGMWKFEIDDSGMKYSADGDMRLQQNPEYQRMVELTFKGELSDAEQTELERLESKFENEVWDEKYLLSDYIQHDELFRAYPQLKWVTLRFEPMEAGEKGRYNPQSNTITVNEKYKNQFPESTIIHEIQHAIQNAEGFARGSSPLYWAAQDEENGTVVKSLRNEHGEILRNLTREDANRYIRYKELERELQRLESAEDGTPEAARYVQLERESDRLYEQMWGEKWFQRLLDLDRQIVNPGEVYNRLYHNTAGEIEARDAEARRTWDAQRRRETPPTLGGKNAVFAENSGNENSIEVLPDGEKYVKADRQVIFGNDPVSWGEQVENYINRKIRKGENVQLIAEDGDVLTLTPETASKAKHRYNKDGSQMTDDYYWSKLNAEAHIDELAKTSRRGKTKNDVSGRHGSLASGGWNYRTAYFRDFDGKYYEIAISVAIGNDGNVVYHVGDMKERSFPGVDGSSTKGGAQNGKTSSGNRVPQDDKSVKNNGQRSIGGVYGDVLREKQTQIKTLEELNRETDRIIEEGRAAGKSPQEIGKEIDALRDRVYRENNWARTPDLNAGVQERQEQNAAEETLARRSIEALPTKARESVERTERTMLRKISDALSVPRFAQRESLRGMVRELSEEYLNTGTVSDETINDIFDRAWEEGVMIDGAYAIDNEPIKNLLRTTAITISNQDKADFTNWGDFFRSTRGTLRITNSGTPVDIFYQTLSEENPALFPERITHPADQLRRMQEVAQSIVQTEKSLDDYYGENAEDVRSWAKHDFSEAVNDAVSNLRLAKRYADERAEAESEQIISEQEAAELYPKIKELRRSYEKVMGRELLTQHDQAQLGRLLRGELELDMLDPTRDNVKGITAVYEAKKPYEEASRAINEWKKTKKAARRKKADDFLASVLQWKDKAKGILYSRETMERNIRDIVPDRALAQRIIDHYFTAVHTAAAAANRTKNDLRRRVKALGLSRKVTAGNEVSEAYAVQFLGEAQSNIEMLEEKTNRQAQRDGKTLEEWRAAVRDFKSANPKLDYGKVERSIEAFREIYDELFTKMNEARMRNGYEPVSYRKGYFPHFQETESDGILASFGKALGIETEVTSLPTTINGLTHSFKPGIRWFGNALERKGFATAYDALQGFDRYIEGAADVIHQTDNIQELRALATQIRYRASDEGIRKQVDAVREDTTLTEDLKEAKIKEIYEGAPNALSNFVVELDEYTNLLANKKSRSDRDMEQALGRDMFNLVKALESRVAANMVAINPGSWLTNFIPITQGAATLDSKALLWGMAETLKAYKSDDGMVGRSSFLTNRRGSDPLVRTWSQNASAVLSSPMSLIDNFTADTLVRARYHQNVSKGLSEDSALSEADTWAAGVMADRSKGAMPTLFQRSNPITKLFTQFQLEVNNQLSYAFKDIPDELKEKGAAALTMALLKFAIGAFLYNEVYEKIVGRRAALDPIGILNDTVGDFTGYELPNVIDLAKGTVTGDMPSFETERVGVYDAAANFAGTVAEELPFIGGVLGGGRVPISSALPSVPNLGKALLNENWSTEKKLAALGKEAAKPMAYILPPFGGGMLKRAYEGAKAAAEGGSYSTNAQGEKLLQYPVYTDTPGEAAVNTARAMVFGKTSLPEGQEWIESGFKSLGAKETAAYQAMMQEGISGREAYELLQDLRAVEKTETKSEAEREREVLQASAMDGKGKSIIYYMTMATDKEREIMDTLETSGADMGEATETLMALKGKEKTQDKWRVIDASNLTEEQKVMMLREEAPNMAEKYDGFTEAGIDAESAYALTGAISELKPEPGKNDVSSAQKCRTVIDAGLDEREQMAAFAEVLGEDEYEKVETIHDEGVTPEAYTRYREILPMYDWNKNGNYTQEEAQAAIDSMAYGGGAKVPSLTGKYEGAVKLTTEQKAALWQAQNKSWQPERNPYSVIVGRRVYNALNGIEETGKPVQVPQLDNGYGPYSKKAQKQQASPLAGYSIQSQYGNVLDKYRFK